MISRSTGMKVFIPCAVAAIVNAVLSLIVIYLLFARLFSIIGSGKAVFLDWIVIFGGLLLVLVKFAVAVACALYAFVVRELEPYYSIMKSLGYLAAGIDLLFFVIYLALMLILGPKDPTGLAHNLFMVMMILTLLETLSAAAYVWFLPVPPIMNPFSMNPYSYMPVFQLFPQQQMMTPVPNF